jgi:thiamine pyrophosphokinase
MSRAFPVQEPIAAPVLSFDGVLVIVGGGTLDLELLRGLAAAGAHLVGADGGGDVVRAAGLVPEAIVGDFDSLADSGSWDNRTRLIRITEQDTTDFEKALYSTEAPVTIGLGMTGRRLDHTLAALDAVARYARGRAIVLVDEFDLAIGLAGPFSFAVESGARVSIHPLTATRFARSDGLRYALDGLTMAPGVRTGTSNEAVFADFRIEPEAGNSGVFLLILEKRWLGPLIAQLMGRL